jgi:hypothetical protein
MNALPIKTSLKSALVGGWTLAALCVYAQSAAAIELTGWLLADQPTAAAPYSPSAQYGYN